MLGGRETGLVKYRDNLSDYRFLANFEGGKLCYCCSRENPISPGRSRSLIRPQPLESSPFLIISTFQPLDFTRYPRLTLFLSRARIISSEAGIALCISSGSLPPVGKLPCAPTLTNPDIYRGWSSHGGRCIRNCQRASANKKPRS